MEELGRAVEEKRRQAWEGMISVDTVFQAATSIKKFNKMTGMQAVCYWIHRCGRV